MNPALARLFEKHHISPKDRYEINQIFGLLPDEKKQNLLRNFWVLALKLQKIEQDLDAEREILLPSSIEKLRKAMDAAEKRLAQESAQKEMETLKQNM